jgi:pilus assembly protein CpaB
VISLVVAALGAFLMAVYVQRFEEERTGGAPVSILVAVKTIKRDTQLTDDALAVRDVPVAYVDSRAVRATDKTRIVGVRVVNSLQPGQVLTWTDVAAGNNDRRTLSSLVQPGFRAVSVRTRSDSTSYELIEPGDRVDVITTISPTPEQRSSVVLLQNILVLAVGTDTGSEAATIQSSQQQQQRRGEQVLTLSLKIPEAQLLAVALDKGTVTVALRHPDDVRVTEGVPDLASSAIGDPKARSVVNAARRTPSASSRSANEGRGAF